MSFTSLPVSQCYFGNIDLITVLYGNTDYPDVALRLILPRLKEAFAAFSKLPSQSTKAARSHAAEDRRLANVLPSEKEPQIQLGVAKEDAEKQATERETITHAYLWPRLSSFFKEGDVIVGETGTAEFGILDTTLPKNVSLLLQGLWLHISVLNYC